MKTMSIITNTIPRPVFYLSIAFVVISLGLFPQKLEARPVSVAVLGLENLNRDPRYDYLEGMILGVLMYDLTRANDVVLVERARMDRILDEQNLRLTGLLNDEDTAKQVGQLAGADALIEGDFAFLGQDLIVNLRILMVDEGKTTALTMRGQTENNIHKLAEQIVENLTGKPVIFAGVEGERSLLSLSDEKPGSIEFYCNFLRGEIFVDNEFYGYTPGGTTPTLLEDLSPGDHEIRVEAGNDFGEIEWPQVIFKDWKRTVNIKPGRKSVVRASIYHFNQLIYDAAYLVRDSWRLEKGVTETLDIVEDGSYVDRNGNKVPVEVRLTGTIAEGKSRVHLEVESRGKKYDWDFECFEDEIDVSDFAGDLEVDFDEDWYSNYWYIELSVSRTDIYQGIHRDERQ